MTKYIYYKVAEARQGDEYYFPMVDKLPENSDIDKFLHKKMIQWRGAERDEDIQISDGMYSDSDYVWECIAHEIIDINTYNLLKKYI